MRVHTHLFVLSFLLAAACGKGPDEAFPAPDSAPPQLAPARAADPPARAAQAARAQPAAPAQPAATAQPAAQPGHADAPHAAHACDGKGEPQDGPVVARERVEISLGQAPSRGDARAPVTLVVFSDFECPFCARLEPRLLALEERYRGRVRLVFKNQPLPFHDDARELAQAALAADMQGKFWEFHTAIFASKPRGREAIERLAAEAGLDAARLRRDMDSEAVDRRIVADVGEAARLGVKGTPTVFINGRRVVGAQSADVFASVIEEELASPPR